MKYVLGSLMIALVLAGCGGGDGGSSDDATTPADDATTEAAGTGGEQTEGGDTGGDTGGDAGMPGAFIEGQIQLELSGELPDSLPPILDLPLNPESATFRNPAVAGQPGISAMTFNVNNELPSVSLSVIEEVGEQAEPVFVISAESGNYDSAQEANEQPQPACTITVDEATADTVSGTIECTGFTSNGEAPIDVTGTFTATAG